MWPVNYRFIVFTDKNKNNIFYSCKFCFFVILFLKQKFSANGCLLEQFQVENDEVNFLKRWKILDDGTAITGITDFEDDQKTGCLMITGENHVVLFDSNHEKIVSKIKITDRIIYCKKLEFVSI